MTHIDTPIPSLLALSEQMIAEQLRLDGVNPCHARLLWRLLHRDLAHDVTAMQQSCREFPPPLQRWLQEQLGPAARYHIERPALRQQTSSADGSTQKFLLALDDQRLIETVLMAYPGRMTACVSSQVGCAMGCVFCATGQMGFKRHLTTGEIIAQVLFLQRHLQANGQPALRNLVLMGMGEPLHNYEAVMAALEQIRHVRGASISPRRITISTVGLVPGILRLAEERQPYQLAVSLHGANDAQRQALVPLGKKWPLAELMAACHFYNQRTGQRIFFEWTLVHGSNDQIEHAHELAQLLAGLDAHVNLIPLNPTAGFSGQRPELVQADAFHRTLKSYGIPCTFRQFRGIDVAAGCGQLSTQVTAAAIQRLPHREH